MPWKLSGSPWPRLDSTIYHLTVTAETRTERLAEIRNGMPNGTENSLEKRQPPELHQKFRDALFENFRSIWFCTGISEILVQWMAPSEHWYNDAPRNWQNVFIVTGIRYLRVLQWGSTVINTVTASAQAWCMYSCTVSSYFSASMAKFLTSLGFGMWCIGV